MVIWQNPAPDFFNSWKLVKRFPLEAIHGAVAMDALLISQRVGNELQPYIGPESELGIILINEQYFSKYIEILDRQIVSLQEEATRLFDGKPASYFAKSN